jgi:hypothetical protein
LKKYKFILYGKKIIISTGYSSEEIKALFNKDERYTIGIRLYGVYQVSPGLPSRKLESRIRIGGAEG